MPEFEERWRSEVAGDTVNRLLVHEASGSVFIGDGWGVHYPALRLHRLDLATGAHLADVRTRHQGTSGLAISSGSLFAATDSRLFELALEDLSIRRQWDRGLVRFAMQLVPADSRLVAANWLMASIGIFDPSSGRNQRVRVGRQPLLMKHKGVVKVASGFDGGLATLDPERGRLVDRVPTLPIASADAGDDVWAIVAGPPQGGQGEPPVWTKEGTDTLVRLPGSEWRAHLPGPCDSVYCDDKRGLVWCRMKAPGRELVAVSQQDGRVLNAYLPPNGFKFHTLDPDAGVAFAMLEHHVIHGNRLVSSTSTCACLAMPRV